MLAEALVPHTLDSTTVANPLGLRSLGPLSGVLPALVMMMFAYAVLLSVGTGIRLSVVARRAGVRLGGAAWGAGVVLLLTFLGQAAVPESSVWARER